MITISNGVSHCAKPIAHIFLSIRRRDALHQCGDILDFQPKLVTSLLNFDSRVRLRIGN